MLRTAPVIGLWLFAVLLAGCNDATVDLAGVRSYARTTEAARAAFDAIAADYDASCLRIREYQVDPAYALVPPPTPVAPDAFAHPVRESDDPDVLAPLPPPASAAVKPFFPAARNPESCVEVAQPDVYPVGIVSADWRKANDALLAFVAGIGKIANVGEPPKPTDKLTSALVDAKAMTKTQAGAVNAVAVAVTTYFFRHRQEQSIAAYVDAVDPRFSDARDALLGVDGAYENVVAAECNVKDSFYERSVAAARDGSFVTSPLRHDAAADADRRFARDYTIYGIRAGWAAANGDCRRRLDAADAYARTVEAIAKTEHDLYKNAHEPGTVDLVSDATGVADAIDALAALTRPAPSVPGKKE